MKWTFSIIFFLIIVNSYSQPLPGWGINFGGHEDDFVKDLVVNKNGSSFVCGTFQDKIRFANGQPQMQQVNGNVVNCCATNSFIAKYNNSGGFEWGKHIAGSTGSNYNNYYGAQFITIDEESNLYVMGGFGDTINVDGNAIYGLDADDKYVIKLDSSGNYIWSKVISSSLDGFDMSLSYSRGKIIFYSNFFTDSIKVADTVLYNTTQRTGNYIAALDTSGASISTLLLPVTDSGSTIGSLELHSVKTDINGNIYLLGLFKGQLWIKNYLMINVNSYLEMFLIKLDSNYDLIYDKRISPDAVIQNNFHPLAVDTNGNAFIAGSYYDDTLRVDSQYILRTGPNANAFCGKFDSQGVLDWLKNIHNNSYTNINSIFTNNNFVTLIGWNHDSAYFDNTLISQTYNSYLLTIDYSGNYISSIGDREWVMSEFSHGYMDSDNDIYVISNGGAPTPGYLYVLGHSLSSYGEQDGCLAKYDNTITSISKSSFENSSINVFPNPFTSAITIESNDNSDIEIFDLYGRFLSKTHSSSMKQTIDLSTYSTGIYLLKISNSKGVFCFTVVKRS